MTKPIKPPTMPAHRRCQLVPYDGEKDGEHGCCKSQTPDHLIPKASFFKGTVKEGSLD